MKNKKTKQTKKQDFLLKEYFSNWKYIKELRNYLLFVFVVFLLSTLLALVYQPPEIIELIEKFLKELVEKTSGLTAWQMIIFILNNNLSTSFFSMLSGILFGIFPVLVSLSNGYVLGYVSGAVVETGGISNLWRLLPHGIFEFPAIILSLALGTKLGMFWFAKKDKRKEEFLKRLKQSISIFLLIILPLLIIAAIIEGLLIVLLR